LLTLHHQALGEKSSHEKEQLILSDSEVESLVNQTAKDYKPVSIAIPSSTFLVLVGLLFLELLALVELCLLPMLTCNQTNLQTNA
jgi:hypothetical protein